MLEYSYMYNISTVVHVTEFKVFHYTLFFPFVFNFHCIALSAGLQ